MKLDELKNKKILILGFGREGQDTFRFLRKLFPNKVLGIADIKIKDLRFKIDNKKVKWHLGEDYLKSLKNYDIIIKSPGVPFKILPKTAVKKITSQTEIFFENCSNIIIGIAGTKGKSTTSSFIYQTLKQEGIKAHLIGNIGKPVLSYLFSDSSKKVYVYELSSFQLMNLKKSPQIAVLLNSYPDHLDWHKDFDEYLQANANIARYQTEKDFLIYNSQDKLIREIAKKSKAKKIPIATNYEFKRITKKLIGEFNLQNIKAAIAVAKIFGIPDKKIAKAIKNFKSLPHRLELVGTYQGITFYNDSLSVIPETTIGALDFLANKVQTLILGGFDRGLNFNDLAKRILESKVNPVRKDKFSNGVKNLILFPTTGQRIWQELKKELRGFRNPSDIKYFFVENMKDTVRLAYQHTKKGKICLLSPASPSFGIFKDYRQRGNLFKKYVQKFSKPY